MACVKYYSLSSFPFYFFLILFDYSCLALRSLHFDTCQWNNLLISCQSWYSSRFYFISLPCPYFSLIIFSAALLTLFLRILMTLSSSFISNLLSRLYLASLLQIFDSILADLDLISRQGCFNLLKFNSLNISQKHILTSLSQPLKRLTC